MRLFSVLMGYHVQSTCTSTRLTVYGPAPLG